MKQSTLLFLLLSAILFYTTCAAIDDLSPYIEHMKKMEALQEETQNFIKKTNEHQAREEKAEALFHAGGGHLNIYYERDLKQDLDVTFKEIRDNTAREFVMEMMDKKGNITEQSLVNNLALFVTAVEKNGGNLLELSTLVERRATNSDGLAATVGLGTKNVKVRSNLFKVAKSLNRELDVPLVENFALLKKEDALNGPVSAANVLKGDLLSAEQRSYLEGKGMAQVLENSDSYQAAVRRLLGQNK